MVAPPSSSTGLHNNQRVEDLTKRATLVERQAQELAEQLQQIEAQMEAQRQQMEAQMAGQKQQMEAQMDDMRSWQKNMEAMMQSIMTQKRGTPPW
ncbi:hypothetical protein MRB53_032690 [Persea americana]|uniref:Uncharacterized protein n=1 Tax=Persea americana TaxID=3435 RepID=A0ACC2KSY4_PERAE|nr:hypothetical protein MRB53_032690 [Persea americana]